jgi:hypothetical protein
MSVLQASYGPGATMRVALMVGGLGLSHSAAGAFQRPLKTFQGPFKSLLAPFQRPLIEAFREPFEGLDIRPLHASQGPFEGFSKASKGLSKAF